MSMHVVLDTSDPIWPAIALIERVRDDAGITYDQALHAINAYEAWHEERNHGARLAQLIRAVLFHYDHDPHAHVEDADEENRGHCVACWDPWPCPPAELLAALGRPEDRP